METAPPSSFALALAAAACTAACAGTMPPPASDTVCHAPVGATSEHAPPSARRAPRERDFVSLLLHDRARGPRSCAGAALKPAPPGSRCGGDPDGPRWQRTPPFAALIESVGKEHFIVWVGTHRRGEAELFGPIARVARTPAGLEVRAMGMMRGPAVDPRLEPLQVGGGEAFLLTGQRCDRPGASGACARRARVVLVRPPRMGPALWGTQDARRGCPAHVDLERRDIVTERGIDHSYVASAIVEAVPGGLVVNEHVAIERPGASDGDAPSRTVREVSAVRRLHLLGVHLRPDRPPLQSRVIRQRAPGGPKRQSQGGAREAGSRPDAGPSAATGARGAR